MALKEQVSNVYGVGLRNVGSYQVSGTPWVTGSAILTAKTQRHTFPYVSKSFTLINTGSYEIMVHFADDDDKKVTADGDSNAVTFATSDDWFDHDHFITVQANGSVTFDVKCRYVYISNNSGNNSGYQLFGELTNIPGARMYELTGSGITAAP